MRQLVIEKILSCWSNYSSKEELEVMSDEDLLEKLFDIKDYETSCENSQDW